MFIQTDTEATLSVQLNKFKFMASGNKTEYILKIKKSSNLAKHVFITNDISFTLTSTATLSLSSSQLTSQMCNACY